MGDKKIKINFIINSLDGGGAEKVLIDLVNNLSIEKYDITISSLSDGVNSKRMIKNIKWRHLCKRNSLIEKIMHHMPLFILCRFLVKKDSDINVAYLEGLPTKVLAKGKLNGRKVAFIHMDISKSNVFTSLYKNKNKCLKDYNRFDRVCFVSRDAMNSFISYYGEIKTACVLHNVVDLRKAYELSKMDVIAQNSIHNDRFKICMVGRLSPEKGINRALDAFSILNAKHNFDVYIVGDGKEKKALIEKKEKLDLNNVFFLGFQENPYSIISKMDLLLCTSFFEGYSTVTIEAISLGVPVLTTDCAGMKDILMGGKYGIITKNDISSIIDGLDNVLSDRCLYETLKKNTDHYCMKLDRNNMCADYDKLFNDMMREDL